MQVEIKDLSSSGSGVGHVDGLTVFVDGALPGEVVEVGPLKKKKRYARAEMVRVVKASGDRVTPVCPLFGTCGGCQLMHMNYQAQLAFKRRRVEEAFRRIGGCDVQVAECMGSEKQLHYRNKIHLHKGGFYKRHSHEVVQVEKCFIHNEVGETQLEEARKAKEAVIKTSIADGEVMVIADGKAVDRKVIYETLGDLRFEIGPRDFFQINSGQAVKLYQTAVEFAGLKSDERVIDAYCGVGCLSLFAARKARSVHGIESGRAAISRARKNAALNGIENVTFECAHVEERNLNCDVLFLNPPRDGLHESVIDKVQAERCIYISCDPATLARDVKRLGYRAVRVQPIDMFPQTVHVETVCLLER